MTSWTISRFFATMAITLALLTALPTALHAQRRGNVSITPTISYMWGGSFETYDGDIQLEDGVQYGGIVDFEVARDIKMELTYATMASQATFNPYFVGTASPLTGLDMGINIHYFQLGAIQELGRGRTRPFMGFAMGAVLFHPVEDRFQGYTLEDTWRFAMSASLGVKIALSDAVAIRLQGRMFLPIYFTGGGVWVGTGGASIGASGAIPIVQGDLGAGLQISL